MRTVIYLDVLLLVNFVVGAAFLLAAGLLGVKLPRSGRGLLALAAGCVVFFALSTSSYPRCGSGCW